MFKDWSLTDAHHSYCGPLLVGLAKCLQASWTNDLQCLTYTANPSQVVGHKVMLIKLWVWSLIVNFWFKSLIFEVGASPAVDDEHLQMPQIANRAETTITILLNNRTLLLDAIGRYYWSILSGDSNRLFVRRTLKIVWMAVSNPFSRFARNSKGIVKGENASLKTLYWRVFTEDILLSYWRHSIALQKTLFSSPLVSITKGF